MVKAIIIGCLPVLMMTACQPNQSQSGTSGRNSVIDSIIIQTAKEAYEFGFPMMVMHATEKMMTIFKRANTEDGKQVAPINQLFNSNYFPNDKFRNVVRPNNDTYYSVATLDLSKEPMVLQLPNTNGRYYLFPMLDAWSNVFFSPGKRTTGTHAQTYLITSPKWKGEVPKGMQQVKAPTTKVWVIGRTQVNSAQDGATVVKKIQYGYKLIPLSVYGKSYVPPTGKFDPAIPLKSPNDIVIEMPTADYFNLLNKLMVNNPPAEDDSAMMKKLAALGIAPGATFDLSEFSSAVQDSMKSIPAWAKTDMMQNGVSHAKQVNGWSINKGLGSYGINYTLRAGVAYNGLGANLDADAMYPASVTDADGQAYDGSKHNYVLHFDAGQFPPANAFWSLTMYNSEGFLCSNPINRFAIGDRNSLKKNNDGSVDIFIQKDNPAKDKDNNWLPAPNGPFNLLLRVYWPKQEMIDGSWTPPAVKKLE